MTYSFSKFLQLASLAGAAALLVTPAAQAAIDIHWANVSGQGNLVKSSDPATVHPLDPKVPGTYSIDFGFNVGRCALGATIGTTGFNVPGFGLIIAYQSPADDEAIIVETRDARNNPANRGFFVVATCGQN